MNPNLDKLIKEKIEEFDDVEIRKHIKVIPIPGGVRVEIDSAKIQNKIKSSLKDISYKSIEAVRKKRERNMPDSGIEHFFAIGYNQSIQDSAEKEKEFKGR